MLHLSASCRYYLHRSSIDMRKGFDSLCGIDSLELQMNVLNGSVFIFIKRLIFGSKNERFIAAESSPSQLSLDVQADAAAGCSVTNTQKIEYVRNTTQVIKKHPGRTKLPEHLERCEIIIEPAELVLS